MLCLLMIWNGIDRPKNEISKDIWIQNVLDCLTTESNEEIKDALYYLQSNRLIIEQSNAITSQINGHPIHMIDNHANPKKIRIC